ncbi:hypothetical protein Cgig2_004489 [Carnegiea gigantea]|uniref:Uncharacterized protein n=1 Tax=Carnegiea gigantea TaxID=171969 RepID=A0A9Q1Q5Z6_9CARY|nr:hypothetical protein Cgig2_004489 [Carnegiea gigantea]
MFAVQVEQARLRLHLMFSVVNEDFSISPGGASAPKIPQQRQRTEQEKPHRKRWTGEIPARLRRPESTAELAGSDKNFRRTQHLDRQLPTPSSDAQILRKTKGNPSNPRTTTGKRAAGGSQRPKVHRTSGNPPMTTPGTLNSTGHLLSSRPVFPTKRRGRKEVGAGTRRGGYLVAH